MKILKKWITSPKVCGSRRSKSYWSLCPGIYVPTRRTGKVNVIFYPMPRDFRNSIAFWKFPRHRPFALVKTTCRLRWLWSNGGMILTGENRNTWMKVCPRANLSTTNFTRTDLGSNSGLHSGRPATNSLNLGTADTYGHHNNISM